MRLLRRLRTVPLRLRSILNRRRVEQELDDELRYHVERQTDQYVAEGMALEEARREALQPSAASNNTRKPPAICALSGTLTT